MRITNFLRQLWKDCVGAVTVSNANTTTRYMTFRFDIIATADADTTTGDVAHGLPATPTEYYITPIGTPGGLSVWKFTAAPNATNVNLTKGVAVGSGDAAIQAHVVCKVPHTLTG